MDLPAPILPALSFPTFFILLLSLFSLSISDPRIQLGALSFLFPSSLFLSLVTPSFLTVTPSPLYMTSSFFIVDPASSTLAAPPVFTNSSKYANFIFKFKDKHTAILCSDFRKRKTSYDFYAIFPVKLNAKRCDFTPKVSCLTATHAPFCLENPFFGRGLVADKLDRLVSEFRSLSEPIDRVKRLLHYATLLPPMDESGRVPENRVMGCTTQVWLEVGMDEFGRMRFRVDSDSEITKGFCSCLIWIMDDAEPEEVLRVKAEDLVDVNVGLHRKAKSRVSTWHSVLNNMHKATEALVIQRRRLPMASVL